MPIYVADYGADWELVPAAVADAAPPEAVDLGVLAALEELQAEGEPDIVVELIDVYLEESPRQLVLMLKADARRDASALGRAAHSLKWSSASLGALRVAALCEELEREGRGDSPRRAGALIVRLGRELEGARRVFAAERRKRS
jgi:HPt (histidine-containing phosphotransfer) domain-containing protein